MDRYRNFRFILLFGLILSLAGILLAQGTPAKILVVNGKTVDTVIVQIEGRSYVDIEALGQITNGVVTVEPNRIVLTIPVPNSSAPASAPASVPPPQIVEGISKDFARIAVAELAEMREWRGAVGTMITYGLAVSGSWTQDYHDRVEAGLMQATVAATTESDQNALALLKNEFDKLSGWASDTVAAREALNGAQTVDPNALQNDAVLAKITDCSQFLSGMIVSGVFTDNSSCH